MEENVKKTITITCHGEFVAELSVYAVLVSEALYCDDSGVAYAYDYELSDVSVVDTDTKQELDACQVLGVDEEELCEMMRRRETELHVEVAA
jgi:hypothetical protein